MLRTQLYADPTGRFVHDVVLESCRQNGGKTALIDTSCDRRLTFAEYGSLVESLARGLISAGLAPGEVIAIFLPNSWEFAITYHAATLAGARCEKATKNKKAAHSTIPIQATPSRPAQRNKAPVIATLASEIGSIIFQPSRMIWS